MRLAEYASLDVTAERTYEVLLSWEDSDSAQENIDNCWSGPNFVEHTCIHLPAYPRSSISKMSTLAALHDTGLEEVEHDSERTKQRSNNYAKKVALVSSSIAALASGTPYLYGVYSPQLINRCGFSALDSSYLSFSGNIGSSIGGFFAGLIIDKFGISAGILLGALLEFTGFFIFYVNYKYALHNFLHLIFAMVCIGFGSVLAYFATIKVATLNFPHHRGFANACPVSSYGLAALFYAFVSTVWFADDVEGLLRFIALFAGIVIAVSSIFIRIYENDDDENDDDDEHGEHDHELIDSSDENEFEVGIQYLLKGHRGSFAQMGNLLRNESSASLFSDVSEVSSMASSTPTSRNSSINISRNSSFGSQNPISISQSGALRSNSNNAFPGSSESPIDFKAKQTMFRSGSFRIASSISNSPRNSRWFGSMNQKQPITFPKATPTEESPLIGSSSSDPPQTANTTLANSLSSSPGVQFTNSPKSPNDPKSTTSQSFTNLPATPNITSPDSTNLNNSDFYFNTKNSNIKHDSATNLTNLVNNGKPKSRGSRGSRGSRKKKKLSPKEHIIELFKNKLFLSHYILNACYCSIGQVYIFSIGFIVRAQVNYYRIHNPSSLVLKLALHLSKATNSGNLAVTYQALQVSIISFSNFLGRLVSGPASDLLHKKLKLSKIYVVIFSLLFLTLGQVSLLISNKLDLLSLTSFLIGLSYGSIYGTMPSIVADSFGSKNFATTWALMGTGPISLFLVLSDYFGTVYDKNSEWSYLGDKKLKMCLKGKECYWDVFALNTVACLVLFTGYFWLLFYEKKSKK